MKRVAKWRILAVVSGGLIAVGGILIALGTASLIGAIPNPSAPWLDWSLVRVTLVRGILLFVPGQVLWHYSAKREREVMGLSADADSGADESSVS